MFARSVEGLAGLGPVAVRESEDEVIAEDDVIACSLAASGESLADARHLVDRWAGRLDADLFQTARLLVSELLVLSIRRPEADPSEQVTLQLELSDERLRVQVAGVRGFSFATYEGEAPDWGLQLIDELSDRWGVGRAARATVCWLELDC
jgi:hypothetical protein